MSEILTKYYKWYCYNLPENVSEINPEVKGNDGYITSQHGLSQSKSD